MMMHQRGPASVNSDNSNVAQNFNINHGSNRQIADFGIAGKPVQNVQKIHPVPGHAMNYNAQFSQNDIMNQFEDNRSEYSVGNMSLRTASQYGVTSALRGSDLPHVNYTQPQNRGRNNSRSTYRDGSGDRFSHRLSNSPHRSQMDAYHRDGMNASQSTTTFSQVTGAAPGQNQIAVTSMSFRSNLMDENAVPQQAELQAMMEEQKTIDKVKAKQAQVESFRAKTATNAQQRLKQERAEKKKSDEAAKAQERERLLRAKEYGSKSRELAVRKAQQKKKEKKEVAESEDGPQPHVYKNTHAITPENMALQHQQDVIKEQDSEFEASIVNVDLSDQRKEFEQKNAVINMYKRIDQPQLLKVGLRQKQLLAEEAISDVHQFSMLQRFRGNKDFKMVDKTKPIPVTARDLASDDDSDIEEDTENINQQNRRPLGSVTERVQGAKLIAINEELKAIEQKWWLQGDVESVKRNMIAQKEKAKAKIERERYLKALRVLVSEKSGMDGEIPNLCSCGALKDNVVSAMRDGGGEEGSIQVCASNCQYYNNTKGYERALRDILHCTTFFK